ncbi:MAG: ABC transporter permease [Vicinamibacterales bacterium]|jgi:predicted permease|nr:ABC transporter permease [Vicinamibacterales bacterium]
MPRFRRLFRFPWRPTHQIDVDLDTEVQFHLDMRTEELINDGMTPDRARAEARRQFGDLEEMRRYCQSLDHHTERLARRRRWLDVLGQDLRFALRTFRKSPGFAAVAVLTLGLGIGGSAAIFTVVNSVILKPLPYHETDRLASIGAQLTVSAETRWVPWISRALYHQIRAMPRIVADMGLYRFWGETTLVEDGEPERVLEVGVTQGLFEMLGARPALGRSFLPSDIEVSTQEGEDVRAGGQLLLSHAFWQRRYGGDPSILGRTIPINDRSRQVIGVMPPGFAFPSPETQIWSLLAPSRIGFGAWNRRAVVRLQPGVSVAAAETRFNTIMPGLPEAFPGEKIAWDMYPRLTVEPLKDAVVGGVGRTLWIVFGAVVFVLLMACANVTNLFLVRAEARRREIAVRTAVGAGRGQLARHFLAEGIGLAAVGGLLGLGLAMVAVRVLVRVGPADLPRLHEVTVDPVVVAFTAAVAILSGVLFGAIALVHGRSAMLPALGEGTLASGVGRSRLQVRNVLVVSQVAFALVLLVGSGLMIRSFWHLTRVDPGFDPANVLTFDLWRSSEQSSDATYAFHEELLARLGGLPGVEAVAAATCVPLRGDRCAGGQNLREKDVVSDEISTVWKVAASPGYFEVLRIPLVAGRLFEPGPRDAWSVVLSASAARARWPGQDPIGRLVTIGSSTGPPPDRWYTVVGVVGDLPVAELTGPEERRLSQAIYFPKAAHAASPHLPSYVMRTSTPPLALVDAVRASVRSIDANFFLSHIHTLEASVQTARAPMAFTMVLLVIAGVAALLLGAVGIYGVIAYMVGRRTREIGVRMALGALPADVKGMVLRQGGRVVLAGVLVGLAGAFALTRLMESMVFGVSPTDPATYVAVSVGLMLVTLLASYVPARRAAAVDPTVALRAD